MLVGHLSRHGHDAEGLVRILRHYFGVPVQLAQNVPQWLTLDTRAGAAGSRTPDAAAGRIGVPRWRCAMCSTVFACGSVR